MVRISVATLSIAAFTGVAIANAQPVDFEYGSSSLASRADSEGVADLIERGAFGRLGMIFRPLISQSVRNAAKTTVQGHAKANNHARRGLDSDIEELAERSLGDEDLEEFVERYFSGEDLEELVERGAFGRLGMIFRPLISQSVRNAAKTTVQGHAKANNHARRELDSDFEDLVEREFVDEDYTDLVGRGAFGRLGAIFRPLISQSVRQAGKTAVQGHAKANNYARRNLDSELVERYFAEEDSEEWLERSFAEESLDEMD